MNIQQLNKIVAHAVDIGMHLHQRLIEPDSDRITQSEAKRYIKRLGYQPVMINKWAKAGLLNGHKTSNQQSAIVYYSLTELKTLLTTLQLKDYIG